MPRHNAILGIFLLNACFSDPGTSGTETPTESASAVSATGEPATSSTGDSAAADSSSAPSTASAGDGSSTGGTPATSEGTDTTGSPERLAECDAYCTGCFAAADFDDCYEGCVTAHDALAQRNGAACGVAWLEHRECLGTLPGSDCDLAPGTDGPCRFYARNLAAICDGLVSGDCGPDPGGGGDYCGGDPPTAGTCPDDVRFENVGVEPLDCGSLRVFEGCCSPSGDYFYCEPQGGGMIYEECPPR